ncbi:reverse transcriptase domain-containing protein [Roseovarius nitratireducens]|uniref:reverse transcriptase domain-containing protein n=1 Tax=Roseovarius nitratireducens TaxID=2044597 RepID=UPI0013ED895E|nr:reverse transcriptase domain-containing protein [Roseovarius nitratireducens]
MPKRHGNLYEHAFTLDRLHAAYLRARRGKRKTLSVKRFERDLGANLAAIHDDLTSGDYRPQPYRHFTVYGPKPRRIAAPTFRDVVVQHAIYAMISPIFEATFIDQSYGCRAGGGAHRASDYLQSAMRAAPEDAVLLQMDIRKFYYRIDHAILRSLIERKIKDRALVDLMMRFACDGSGTIGLPIGNLLSQIYALIYLDAMDHFIKRDMKVKRYARYVDDFVIIAEDRETARRIKGQIEAFLSDRLNLELSKWRIATPRQGTNFVGFRTWRSRRFVRKRALYNFSKALREGRVDSLTSIMGHAKRTSSYAHMARRLSAERPDLKLPRKLEATL